MTEETLVVVELQDAFYRDSFGKLVLIIVSFCTAIVLLIALSIYLVLDKPPPLTFPVADEWRVQPPVPLDQPYVATPDLLQWVNDTVQKLFVFDFTNYDDQLAVLKTYFTEDGWRIYLNQLNNYVNYNNVQTNRLFVSMELQGAPIVLNQGLLSGKWGWWVQMPITIKYAGAVPVPSKNITLQILVIRVPTLNNLDGVAIDNIMVDQGTGKGTGVV